jgi:hypothetical protein
MNDAEIIESPPRPPTLSDRDFFEYYQEQIRAAHERKRGLEEAIAHERGQIEALERAALWLQQKLSPPPTE